MARGTKHKGRKKGDWVNVANGRKSSKRELVNHGPGPNYPKAGDVGSAAYRRLLNRGSRKGK